MGILTVMTLIMFTAKVFGFMDWSWWIIMSPLMVNGFLVLLFTTFGLAFIGWRFKR